MRKAATTLALAVLVGSTGAPAWWLTGHTVVNRAAVGALPAEVPAFLKRQIDWIGARSQVPDSWRDATEPYLKAAEDPEHTWYMEELPRLAQLPRSRNEFIRLVPNVNATGLLPYSTIENYERLKVAFRAWRALQARREDTTFIELDAAFYAGWLGHYVADGAMPLHTSRHHNGWVGPNPKNYTTAPGIHGRFEGEFVDLIGLSEPDITGRMHAPQRLADPMAAFLSYLERSHTRVEQVYVLDQQRALQDRGNRAARELVHTCIGEAASMLRDLIYTAWLTSAR
jgi:hypothetical protein